VLRSERVRDASCRSASVAVVTGPIVVGLVLERESIQRPPEACRSGYECLDIESGRPVRTCSEGSTCACASCSDDSVPLQLLRAIGLTIAAVVSCVVTSGRSSGWRFTRSVTLAFVLVAQTIRCQLSSAVL